MDQHAKPRCLRWLHSQATLQLAGGHVRCTRGRRSMSKAWSPACQGRLGATGVPRQTGVVDRTELRALRADFTQWSRQAAAVQRRHGAVREAAEAAERLLESRAVVVQHARRNAWRVVPLERRHSWVVRPLRERAVLPTFTRGDQALIRLLTVEVPRARAEVNAALGLRRYLAGPRT